MSTLNWLEENLHRSYPFVEGAGVANGLLVDAAFTLAPEIGFDFSEEDELRLTSLVVTTGSTWTFKHFRSGVEVQASPSITIQVPENPPPMSTWGGVSSSGESAGHITLGDPGLLQNLAPEAPLEDRVIRAYSVAPAPRVRAFNVVRAASYKPYFSSNPAKSAAQNYLDAVANSPYGGAKTDLLVTSPGIELSGDLELAPGYNAVVEADNTTNQVRVELVPGAGLGRECSTPPKGQGYAGTLRGLNGQPGVRGELLLSVGKDFEIVTDQDNHRVIIRLKALNDAIGCGKASEQLEPSTIPGPP